VSRYPFPASACSLALVQQHYTYCTAAAALHYNKLLAYMLTRIRPEYNPLLTYTNNSNVLGGYLSDKLSPIDARYRAWVPMIGCLLSIPAWAYVVSTDSFSTAMVCLGVKYLVGECWFGPTVTILQV
jgi:hypothetical protein